MAKILEFKLPPKAKPPKPTASALVSSSIDHVMLIIHHALHGTDKAHQPKDRQLAAQLLDELSFHVKHLDENSETDCLILKQDLSQTILDRYPEMYQSQTKKGGG